MKCIFGIENCKTLNNQYVKTDPYQFFIGYQVFSSYYSRSAIESMGSRICELIKLDLKELKIINKPFGFSDAIHIFCNACKLIQPSILCIFEISDSNPNVMLEIGKSQFKNIILLRNKSSDKKPPIDLGGIFYEEYDNEEELITLKSAKIAHII